MVASGGRGRESGGGGGGGAPAVDVVRVKEVVGRPVVAVVVGPCFEGVRESVRASRVQIGGSSRSVESIVDVAVL